MQNESSKLVSLGIKGLFCLILILSDPIMAQKNAKASNGLEYHFENYSKIIEPRTYAEEIGKKYNDPKYYSHPDFGTLPCNAPNKNVVEVISKRKINERYFVDINDPTFFYMQKSVNPMHYQKNGQLIAINPTLHLESSGIYSAPNQVYPTLINFNSHFTNINCDKYSVQNNQYVLTVIDNGNHVQNYNPNWSDYVVGNNGAYVNNIFPGIDMKIVFGESHIKSMFIVKSAIPNAKRLILTDRLNLSSDLILSQLSGNTGGLFEDNIHINDHSGTTQYVIRKAFSIDGSGDRTHMMFNNYRVMGNNIELHVDSSFLNMPGIVYPLTIDPLITAVGPIAAPPNTIGSMLTPLFCTQVLTLTFPGGSMPWDFSTSWATEQITCCSGGGACLNSDPRVEILSNCGGRTPSGAGLYWSCSPGCVTSGTWSPTLPFASSGCQSMVQCLPASCLPQAITFSLNLLRVFCNNTLGCNCTYATNTCSRLQSWNVTLQGRTVEWTNVPNPFTLSTNTVCAGGNITATSNGTGYGVPPLNITWSFNAAGVPTVAAGSPASINFPAAGNYTVYGVVTDQCGGTQIVSKTATAVPIPVANAGLPQQLTCTNPTTVLAGSGGGTYVWSGPGIVSGGATANPNVNVAGTYSLTVNVASCPSTPATVAVTLNNTPPTVAPSSGSLNCTTASTTAAATTTTIPVSYVWTGPGITGGAGTGTITLNAGGTYNYTVTNTSNGCKSSGPIVVTQNTTAPSVAASSGSLNCSVVSTSAAATTTTAPASYIWTGPGITGGAGTGTITLNLGGTYNYTVTNTSNGCVTNGAIVVNQNTITPSIAASSGSLNCTVVSTTAVATTTSIPVSYVWTGPGITGGAGTGTITLNVGGTYNYTVTNTSNGCVTSGPIVVTQNIVTPTLTPAATGSLNCIVPTATLSTTTGVAPVSYLWTGPGITGGAGTGTITCNVGGTYNYTVTNTFNTCKTTGNFIVTQNTAVPSIAAASTGSLNCSVNTVSVSATTTSTPVSYNWTGPSITGGAGTGTITINGGGTYNYTVTNTFNNCVALGNVVVAQNTIVPTTTVSVTGTITCATPSVQLNGAANPGTCTVVWTGGVCGSPIAYTTSACGAGTYTFVATNTFNNCSSIPQSVTVLPNANVPSVVLNNTGTITCITTSVQVAATTTASPVSYVWTGPGITGGAGTPTITVNAGGIYSVVVTNTVNGCSTTITNSITANNAPVTPTATASNTITCSTTTISLTTGAGAGAFNFNWSGPGIIGTNTLATITASLGGSYTATVTDITSGCFGTVSIAASSSTNVPSAISISPSTFTLSCATPTTQLVVTVTGGNTYTWTPPISGTILSGVNSTTANVSGPGIYTVVITGTNGCSAPVATATLIADANSPAVTLSANSGSITCLVAAPGVTATPTGTVTIASYSWSPAGGIASGSNTTTPTFTTAGTYSCLITANNGCTTTTFVTISNNSVIPTASTPTVNNITCGNTNVIINPAYTPTVGLTYTWTGASILGATTNASVTVDQSGTYTVSFVDPSNGCSNTMTVSVNGNTVTPTVTVASTSSIGVGCSASNNTVSLTASSTPSTGVNYIWSNGGVTSVITVTVGGVYSATVTDATNGCSVVTQYTVINNTTLPNVSAGSNTSIPCGSSSLTLNGSSSTSGVTFAWTGGGIVSGSNTPSPIVNAAGIYTLTVTNPTTGCTSQSTVDISLTVVNAAFIEDFITGFAPLNVNFTNLSTGATAYSWNFGNGSAVSTATNPTYIYPNSGVFVVQLIATSGPCSDTAFATINVTDGLTLEIPNVFSPNDDGINDVLTITSTGVKEISLLIFNRWGQKMYEFVGVKAGWDGVTTNGAKAAVGTYFYFVKATGFDDKEINKNGPVSLFR